MFVAFSAWLVSRTLRLHPHNCNICASCVLSAKLSTLCHSVHSKCQIVSRTRVLHTHRARCLRWRTVWGVQCARSRARRAQGRGREAAEPPTHPASPMGLRKLHRGRVGSRHFQNLEENSSGFFVLWAYLLSFFISLYACG